MIVYTSQGKAVHLGERVGAGGEATVYQVIGQPNWLAKIYINRPRPDYGDKLAWMLRNPPENPTRAQRHASLAWPVDLLYDSPRRPAVRRLVGYLMPFVRGSVAILELINPRLRAKTLPQFDTRYLHRAARNLAAAVGAVHERGYVIGDLNESNILVTPSALVTLIDTDSFQVQELRGLKPVVHYCPVGRLEYTAPELQGKPLSQMLRRPEHDAFGLAVLIFQLLMEGNHPFRAQWLEKGDPPPLEARIAMGAFPYMASPGAPVKPPPNGPDFYRLHPQLTELMRRCFADGHQQPGLRPSPASWEQAIAEAEQCLVACPNQHIYSNHLPACPFCAQPARAASPRAAAQPPKPAGPEPARPEPVRPAQGRPAPAPRPAVGQTVKGPPPSAQPTQPQAGRTQAAQGSPAPGPQGPGPQGPGPAARPQPAPGGPTPWAQYQQRALNWAKRQAVAYVRTQVFGLPPTPGPSPAPPAGSTPGRASTGPQTPGSQAQSAGASTAGATAPSAFSTLWNLVRGASPAGAPPAPTSRPVTGGSGVGSAAASTTWGSKPAWGGFSNTRPTRPYRSVMRRHLARPNWGLALAHSTGYGLGYGALVGLLPGLLVGLAAGLLGHELAWALLAALGGAAAGAFHGWKPSGRVSELITYTIGWRRLLQGVGVLCGAALGLLLSLPLIVFIFPPFIGMVAGGMLGFSGGRRLWLAGLPYGWDRIWIRFSAVALAGWGALLARWFALTTLGGEANELAAGFTTWLSVQSASPVLLSAAGGALQGALGGAFAGFLIYLSASLFRLHE